MSGDNLHNDALICKKEKSFLSLIKAFQSKDTTELNITLVPVKKVIIPQQLIEFNYYKL